MNLYAIFDGDSVGQKVGRAALADDPHELARMSTNITDAMGRIGDWITYNGGSVLASGGDELYSEVSPELIPFLEDARRTFFDLTGFTLSGGVAVRLSDASRALMIAKLRGKDRICMWHPDMQDELDEHMKQLEDRSDAEKLHDEYLKKAELFKAESPEGPQSDQSSNPSYADMFAQAASKGQEQAKEQMQGEQSPQEGQADQGSDQDQQIKQAVVQVLQQVKAQMPVLEQLKQVKPETYEAVLGMVQAMAALAQAKFGGQEVQKSEPLDKAEKVTCKCPAYRFPHRQGGGKCTEKADVQQVEQSSELKKDESPWSPVFGRLPRSDKVPSVSALQATGSGNHLGGAGNKTLFQDDKGNKFLFRHAVSKGYGEPEPFRAAGQVAVAQLQQRLKPFSPALNADTYQGTPGVVQQFVPGKPFGRRDPASLSDQEKEDLAAEHIVDWVTSQHDSHPDNLITTPDGRLVGIDKEQAFRWFGKDKLDHEYHPNSQYGTSEPFYNTFWRDFGAGKVDFDTSKLDPYFDALDAYPDSEYAASLVPYAGITGRGTDFIEQAVNRKRNARKDFSEFTKKLLASRPLGKAAASANKTLVHRPSNLDGSSGYPPFQRLDGGRQKVMHSDLSMSPGIPDPSNLSWRQMRAGQIMDSDGSPLSSRRSPSTLPTEKTQDDQ